MELRCESRVDPLGVEARSPRLSWVLQETDPERRGQGQTAYQVLVARNATALDREEGDLWDTGKVASSETIQIPYRGAPLSSRLDCFWKVRVWDADGRASSWSAVARWRMGLLESSDWQARWIGSTEAAPPDVTGWKWIWFPEGEPAVRAAVGARPFCRQAEIVSTPKLRKARLVLTADNELVAFVNGQEVGSANAWEHLHEIDVTDAIAPGPNTIGVLATNGGASPNPAGLVGALLLDFEDGSSRVIATDSTWQTRSTVPEGWPRRRGTDEGLDAAGWVPSKELGAIGMEPWGMPIYASGGGRLPLFRREFLVRSPVRSAVVSLCGLGQYELYLNGQRVGDHEMDPGWTDYRESCLYVTHDVTSRLREGPNAIGVSLGNGMYNVVGGRYVKFRGSFGPPKLILELWLLLEDGTTERVVTDSSWTMAPGPITFSCIYGGEDHDARLEPAGWKEPGFADDDWSSAAEVEGPGGRLVAQSAPPVKRARILPPRRVHEVSPGVFVFDLGQNFSGRPRLRVRGPRGARVRVTPGEILSDSGLAHQGASGGPHYYEYTLRGDGAESWHPRFTYYGFRYLQVEGAVPKAQAAEADEDAVVLLSIEGEYLTSSARRVGEFSCSSELYGRIDRMIDWAVGSNLQSVLTDCPHREKLGWLEVAHLMGPSILASYDVATLYAKIARDTTESQLPSGLVPDIAPEYTVFSGGFRDSPEWGSAAVILPWQLYRWYGDERILEVCYDTMKGYVAYLGSTAQGQLVSHGLGDWADFVKGGGVGASQLTPKELTATAIYYHDVVLVSRIAGLLGRTEDRTRYEALAREVLAAFQERLFDADRRSYASGSQTSNAMPLALDMVAPEHRPGVLRSLVEEVRRRGYITSGDVGFRYLLRALADGGQSELIYEITHRTTLPGYGYQLEQGATSLTEAWDGRRVVSHNHCMLGHIQEWFRHDLAGIGQAEGSVAFEEIVIRPDVVGKIEWVRAHYDSARGRIESAWRRTGDRLELRAVIPPNTTATVVVPTSDPASVREGGRSASEAPDVRLLGSDERSATYRVGSGRYTFRARLRSR
jgi:hypothetical protein